MGKLIMSWCFSFKKEVAHVCVCRLERPEYETHPVSAAACLFLFTNQSQGIIVGFPGQEFTIIICGTVC